MIWIWDHCLCRMGNVPAAPSEGKAVPALGTGQVMDTFFPLFPPIYGSRFKWLLRWSPQGTVVSPGSSVLILALSFSTKTPQELLSTLPKTQPGRGNPCPAPQPLPELLWEGCAGVPDWLCPSPGDFPLSVQGAAGRAQV